MHHYTRPLKERLKRAEKAKLYYSNLVKDPVKKARKRLQSRIAQHKMAIRLHRRYIIHHADAILTLKKNLEEIH